MPILDAGISIVDDTQGMNYFSKGQTQKVFLQSVQNPTLYNGTLIGKVWPGKCAFVDFLSQNASGFWVQGMNDLYERVPFDGIWLDMNEPSNFDDYDHPETGCNYGECPDLPNK